MSRQASCGRVEALQRARVARAYLDVADLAEAESDGAFPNVAAGNAVLAGIAAADAICCLRLGHRNRGQDHRAAVDLMRTVQPDGPQLASALEAVLAAKDLAHYGERFLRPTKLKATLRAAGRLVTAAEDMLTG